MQKDNTAVQWRFDFVQLAVKTLQLAVLVVSQNSNFSLAKKLRANGYNFAVSLYRQQTGSIKQLLLMWARSFLTLHKELQF